MVDITRQMERNAHLGISDFYLVKDEDCKLDHGPQKSSGDCEKEGHGAEEL